MGEVCMGNFFVKSANMITEKNLNNLVNKLTEISQLALKYKLDSISLGKHSYFDNKEKLYFILSRHAEMISLGECAEIHMALCSLLDIERYKEQAHIVVEVKEFFNSGYFDETFSQELSLSTSEGTCEKEAATSFVRDVLGYTQEKYALDKKRTLSVNTRSDGKKQQKKEGPQALSQSIAVFFNGKKQEIKIERTSVLPLRMQHLLQQIEEEFFSHPEYRAAIEERFSEMKAKASKPHVGIG
jgi:hypothetical protein